MRIVFHGLNAQSFMAGFDAVLDPGHTISGVADLPAAASEIADFQSADVIVGNRLDARLPKPERMRLYHAPAAGVEAIDRALLPAGVPLCCCFGHEAPIAEYVMTAMLSRHVPLARADSDLRSGKWTYFWIGQPNIPRTELGDMTVGLLGFGHIGKTIAARAKAFGMRVIVANRSPPPLSDTVDAAYGLADLAAFMGAADYIVVSLPLLAATTGFVGKVALAAMRRDGVIINVGRGPVIDEAALYDALQARRIGGAVIDTWYTYPTPANRETLPASLPFHDLDNVVMTPHMSGWTTGTIRRRQATIADNIRRLAAGEPLRNVV